MIYYLNTDTVPTIPVPHDGIIKKVDIEDHFITFTFEDNLSVHDAVRYYQPDAKSLIIKIHVTNGFDTYKYKYFKWPLCKETYIGIDNNQLIKIAKEEELVYIGHRVSYQSISVELWGKKEIILNIYADYIEFDWIM